MSNTIRAKVTLPGTVLDAALNRIRWIFEEFDGQVTVDNSGGKDSTVVVELAAMVAAERGELPLKVQWLDQECEYDATRRYQRYLADRDDIEFFWYQVPFRLFNATDHSNPWLNVWGVDEDWVRDKEHDSIHEHDFRYRDGSPVDRFKDMLQRINAERGGALLSGMRGQESPARRLTLTTRPVYKWVTWSTAGRDKGYVMFHPIYDWASRDVWKAIHDYDWRYNTIYDVQYRYGVPTREMRVSNYHHETALSALEWLQEAEPETWERATQRLQGLNSHSHLDGVYFPERLPYMFASWEEYLYHLIDNLVDDEERRDTFREMFDRTGEQVPHVPREEIARRVAKAVSLNDVYGTTVDMWRLTKNSDEKHRKALAGEWNGWEAHREEHRPDTDETDEEAML